MLTEIQKLALSNLKLQPNREEIPVGTHAIPPFLVEVSGAVDVLENETYVPTVDIPLIPTVALALKKMGIQREHFMKVMKEAVQEVILSDSRMRAALVSQAGLDEFEAEFRQKVLSELPLKTRKGKVLATLAVNQVTTGLTL
jgi:hypothetical protein